MRWPSERAPSVPPGWRCRRCEPAGWGSRANSGACRSRASSSARDSTFCSPCWPCSATGSYAATTPSSSRIAEVSASIPSSSPLPPFSCSPERCFHSAWCRSQPRSSSGAWPRRAAPSPRSASGSSHGARARTLARSSCSCSRSRSASSPSRTAVPGIARRSTGRGTRPAPNCSWSRAPRAAHRPRSTWPRPTGRSESPLPLPAATDSFDLASSAGESGNLLALDARRAAAAVHPRDDFASRRLDELLRPLGQGRGRLASLPLPGRPTRLALSMRFTIRGSEVVGPGFTYSDRASLFLYLQDGDGVLHLSRLRDLAPGRARRFVVDLVRRLPSSALARPRYPLSVVALELDLDVPYLVPRRAELVMRSLEVAPGAGGRWQRVSLGDDRDWRTVSNGFKYAYEAPTVKTVSATAGSLRVAVTTGSTASGFRSQPAAFLMRPGRDSLPKAPPILASDSFLEATDASIGQVVRLALSGGTHDVRIVGAFHRFPTLDPATPAVVADLPTFLALSFAEDGAIVQPSQWWLTAPSAGRIAESLRAPPFRSIGVVSRSERERALLNDPVSLGVIGALALGFVVAAAFAAVGFAASAAAAARTRVLEFAVMRSLGLGTRQLSRWIALESGLVVVLSLLGGTALGLL